MVDALAGHSSLKHRYPFSLHGNGRKESQKHGIEISIQLLTLLLLGTKDVSVLGKNGASISPSQLGKERKESKKILTRLPSPSTPLS